MTANSSVYFLRFPFADESGILSGFSFMNESKKKYVIILIILDKLRFIIEKSYKNMIKIVDKAPCLCYHRYDWHRYALFSVPFCRLI